MKNVYTDIVDFHAHILPGADHGSSCVQTTISQLAFAKNAGVSRIIATPHFYPHRHKLDFYLKRRAEAYGRLLPFLDDSMPKIKLGTEVLVCEGLEKFDGLSQLCLSGTKMILLELPFSELAFSHLETVCKISDMGYQVVLAHAERYHDRDVEDVLASGARLQLNTEHFSSVFMRKRLFNWINRGVVVALGSDIHHADKSVYKGFLKAKKKLADRLVHIKESSDIIWDNMI